MQTGSRGSLAVPKNIRKGKTYDLSGFECVMAARGVSCGQKASYSAGHCLDATVHLHIIADHNESLFQSRQMLLYGLT